MLMNSRILNRKYISPYLVPFILILACILHDKTEINSSINSMLIERLLFAISLSVISISVIYYSKYLFYKLLNIFLLLSFFALLISVVNKYYILDNIVFLNIEHLSILIIILVILYDKRK
jgi:hypothetical protein